MKNFSVRHHVGLPALGPFLSLDPEFPCRGPNDIDGHHSHVSLSTILSVSDAIAIRDDLTKALIEIDVWQRAHENKASDSAA